MEAQKYKEQEMIFILHHYVVLEDLVMTLKIEQKKMKINFIKH
jgi:hypothetical protein